MDPKFSPGFHTVCLVTLQVDATGSSWAFSAKVPRSSVTVTFCFSSYFFLWLQGDCWIFKVELILPLHEPPALCHNKRAYSHGCHTNRGICMILMITCFLDTTRSKNITLCNQCAFCVEIYTGLLHTLAAHHGSTHIHKIHMYSKCICAYIKAKEFLPGSIMIIKWQS